MADRGREVGRAVERQWYMGECTKIYRPALTSDEPAVAAHWPGRPLLAPGRDFEIPDLGVLYFIFEKD